MNSLLNKSMSDFIHLPQKGKFIHEPFTMGVEIEAEGENLMTDWPGKFWKTAHEGSLRNGIEYVLKSPMPLQGVRKAVEEFEAGSAANHTEYFDSLRTSVHVHLNVYPLTLHSYLKLVAVSWLVESVLVEMNGPNRVGNLFCLRLEDAEVLGHDLIRDVRDIFQESYSINGPFSTSGNQHNRYAATNVAALRKFGSLEYRFMKGMYTSAELYKWCEALRDLAQNSLSFRDLNDIADQAGSLPAYDFLRKLFRREFVEEIMKTVTGLREKLDVNQNIIRELAEVCYKKYFRKPEIYTTEDIPEMKKPQSGSGYRTVGLSDFASWNSIPSSVPGAPQPSPFPPPPQPTNQVFAFASPPTTDPWNVTDPPVFEDFVFENNIEDTANG